MFALSFSVYLGRRHAKYHVRKGSLPDDFPNRYWLLLAPMVLLLLYAIFTNFSQNALDFRESGMFGVCALAYASLAASFASACAETEKKLASARGLWPTCAFVLFLFAVLTGQAWLDFDSVLRPSGNEYGVATLIEDLDRNKEGIRGRVLYDYMSWSKRNRLVTLDAPASLVISGGYPLLDGATAFFPVYWAVADQVYQVDEKVDEKLELNKYITCSRTVAAYERLINGKTDLIFVLQPSDGQMEAARKAGVELRLTPIAKEAFVFFVNASNPVTGLTLEQIQDIYLKKITNWRHVGGNYKKILPFQRPENSGSQTAMVKEVMKDKKLPLPLQEEQSGTMGGLYRDVAKHRDLEEAIGYSFRFFTQEMMIVGSSTRVERFTTAPPGEAKPVKLLAVNGVAPTVENIRSGSYPFTTDVYAVTAGTKNPRVPELIDWLTSPQGQELIEKTGYVGVGKQ
ncbi:MAG: substrate-binding domain-containing protein [Synergistaceae bacterium]|nr:substrate-binding domain-containing protein [Synergistaceae bacterium]